MKYFAFDLEIAKIVGFNQDLDAHRPLGITCAAGWASDSNTPMVWCGRGKHSEIVSAMNTAEVGAMVSYLQSAVYQGYTLLTFNGAGFDFKTIAEYGFADVCSNLALNHVDMFFHLFCLLGYSPGLGRAAKGMGLAGKIEGMDGAQAPQLWQQGRYGEVLQYVAQDVRTTLDLALAVEQASALSWVSKASRPMRIEINRWLTVTEASELPQPDTSWIKDGWSRSKFIGWLR